MIRKTILPLVPSLLLSCGRKTVIPSTTSGVGGIVQERFLPNPVHGGGAPVRVTPLGSANIFVYPAGNTKTKAASGRSDSDGRFFIELKPGDYDLALDDPGVPRSRVKVEPGKPTIITLEKEIAPP